MADRGAQGAGRRGAHLRDHDDEAAAPASTTTPTRARRSTAAWRPRSRRRTRRSRETRGEVVTYNGAPVVTYFFSTSGGRTEDVENTPLGQRAAAVAEVRRRPLRRRLAAPPLGPDPDDARAGRRASSARWSRASSAASRSCERGRSPRIVEADVIGIARAHARDRRAAAGAASGCSTRGRSSPRSRPARSRRPSPTPGPADRRDGAVRLGGVAARPRRSARLTGRVLPVLKSGARAGAAARRRGWVDGRRGARAARRALRLRRHRAGRLPAPVPRRARPRRPRPLISRRHLRLRRGPGRLRGDLQPRARGAADRDRAADDARGSRSRRSWAGRGRRSQRVGGRARPAAPRGASAAATSRRCSPPSRQELQPVPGVVRCARRDRAAELRRLERLAREDPLHARPHGAAASASTAASSAPPRSSTASRRPTSSCTPRRRWAGSPRDCAVVEDSPAGVAGRARPPA